MPGSSKTHKVFFILLRDYIKPDYTIGNLYYDGRWLCNILEDPIRDHNKDGDLNDPGEGKIYGDTAIPYGMYEIILTYSPKFRRELPLLVNVPHFTGIRIHGSKSKVATNKNTHGCLIPGENRVRGGVIETMKYEKVITQLIRDQIRCNNSVFINIA